MEPTKESYGPGDEVEAVAYVGASVPEREDAFIARLDLVPLTDDVQAVAGEGGTARHDWHELGPVTVESTRLSGYLNSRVSIRFQVPAGLEPGRYEVAVRDESGGYLGDLIGMILHVGTQPEALSYEWPLDEALITELPDDAVIAGPGFSVPVGELRAGRYPAGAEDFMLHPETLPHATRRSPEPTEIQMPHVRGHHLSGVPSLPAETHEGIKPAVEPRPFGPTRAPLPPPEQPEEETADLWVAVATILVALIVGFSSRSSGFDAGTAPADGDPARLPDSDETVASGTPSPRP